MLARVAAGRGPDCYHPRRADPAAAAPRRAAQRGTHVVTTRQLSVVMPVHNEAAALCDVIRDVTIHVLDRVPSSELVVVDDRSNDDTPAILRDAAARDPRIRVLVNAANIGHGPSVRRAIDASDGEWIFHLDSDGQVDVAEFALLWSQRVDSDLVIGVRVARKDPLVRLALTRLTRTLVSVLARRPVADANAPFKLVSRSLFEHLAPMIPAKAFAPSILLVLGAHRCGATVTEVPITHFARRHGRSSLHLRRLTLAVARCVVQTIRFARHPCEPYVAR